MTTINTNNDVSNTYYDNSIDNTPTTPPTSTEVRDLVADLLNTKTPAEVQEFMATIAVGMYGLLNPDSDADTLSFLALPSPGALVLQLITETASENRKINRELVFENTQMLIETMLEEAEEIRSNANVQLALGILSGVISLAAGIGGMGAAKGHFGGGSLNEQLRGTYSQALQTATTSIGKMVDAGAGFHGSKSQATQKELQAEAESLRAIIDAIKSYNEAQTETIQKAMQAQQQLADGANQTRTAILRG